MNAQLKWRVTYKNENTNVDASGQILQWKKLQKAIKLQKSKIAARQKRKKKKKKQDNTNTDNKKKKKDNENNS